MTLQKLAWAKGHGTLNDFVIVTDLDGDANLDAAAVRALCDRRAGIGGDGLLRVVRDEADSGRWFMDYRNADGSIAEMCGNGVRVFVEYLRGAGLVHLDDGASIEVGTRAGVKTVRREGNLYAADLGAWRIEATPDELARGANSSVRLHGANASATPLPGLSVNVGNPHVVVSLPDLQTLADADLSRVPGLDPVPPHGANVELVVAGHPQGPASLTMRVNERGVGETKSCGTGAVAAVIASRFWAGPDAPNEWLVQVPGGLLTVRLPEGSHAHGPSAELVGPAVIVAQGEILDL